MKVVYEIMFRDGKKETHNCIDFAAMGNDYVTLYKDNLVREYVPAQNIDRVKSYITIRKVKERAPSKQSNLGFVKPRK